MKPNATYRLLVESLKKDIQEGKYGAGNPFPSVRALVRRYVASYTTRDAEEIAKLLAMLP